MAPSQTASLALDKHRLAQGSSVMKVKSTLEQSNIFSGVDLQGCVSSSLQDKPTEGKGFACFGTDIMVYSGLGSEVFDPESGKWSHESDVVFHVSLPPITIICLK